MRCPVEETIACGVLEQIDPPLHENRAMNTAIPPVVDQPLERPLYSLRYTANNKHIDIVPAGAPPGTGAMLRVPVRDGFSAYALQLATRVCALLNEHDRNMSKTR